MTISELQERQRWNLDQKIDHAVATVETFINRCGKKPYVSFSGGKDSTVLLDLVRRFVDKNILAVFDNTGNEFPEIVNFVKTFPNVEIITPKQNIRNLIAKEGFPLVSKEQSLYIRQIKHTKSDVCRDLRLNGRKTATGRISYCVSKKWRFLREEPFDVSEKCCDILKKRPFAKYNKEHNAAPIIATMTEESRLRKNQYIRRGGCNSFAANHVASYPLSIWTEKDIYSYIEKFHVPICSLYTEHHCTRTGCMFCGFGVHMEKHSRFDLVYKLHPRMYKAFMNYTNNGVTYREALHKIGITLPDEIRQGELFN